MSAFAVALPTTTRAASKNACATKKVPGLPTRTAAPPQTRKARRYMKRRAGQQNEKQIPHRRSQRKFRVAMRGLGSSTTRSLSRKGAALCPTRRERATVRATVQNRRCRAKARRYMRNSPKPNCRKPRRTSPTPTPPTNTACLRWSLPLPPPHRNSWRERNGLATSRNVNRQRPRKNKSLAFKSVA